MTHNTKLSTYEKGMRFLTLIVTIVCALLFILMMVLFSVYIIGTQRSRIIDDELPIDTLLVLKSGGDITVGEDKLSYILPEFIGITLQNDNRRFGIIADKDLTYQLFNSLSDYIVYVFSSSFVCEKFDASAGNSLWKTCLTESNSVYIKFQAGLPDYIIKSFFKDEDDNPSGDAILIKEMFLIFNYRGDDEYNVRAIVKSDIGEVCVYSYDYKSIGQSQKFKLDKLTAFSRMGSLVAFDFYNNYDGKATLSDSAIIFNTPIRTTSVLVNNTEGEYNHNEILKLLGYNIDKLNSYDEYTGAQNYIESFGNLRISPDKTLTFTSSDGSGIKISNFLSYGSYGGDYSVREQVSAVCTAFNAVRASAYGYYGGQAYPVIASILNDGEELTIKFDYYINGMALYKSDNVQSAATFTIKDDLINSIIIYPLNISLTENRIVNYPQLWQLDAYKKINIYDGIIFDMMLGYRTDDIGEAYCQWIFDVNTDIDTQTNGEPS